MLSNDPRNIVFTALNLEEARRHLEKLEARLCASEERFRNLVESTSDWIWETDASFICIYSSPKIQDMSGYTPEEMLGHTLLGFMSAKGAQIAREAGRPFHQIELTVRHKTGRNIVLEISGVPILARDGALQGWRGIARDITRKAEEAQRQQILEDVINQNDALVIVRRVEPDRWPVEFVSGNIGNVLGYTSDDLLSGWVTWQGVIYQDDGPRLEKETAQHLEQGDRKWSQEYRLRTKSGEIRWFRDNNLVLTELAGSITKIQTVIYDITERKKIEEERKIISNRIMRAKEGEQKKIAGAIHDIAGSMLVGLSSSLLLVEEELKHKNIGCAIEKLHQTKELLKELVEMMKNVSADIWPPNLEIAGLSGALSALFSQADSYSKIKIARAVNLPDGWEKNHKRTGIIIYRLMQEAISNAVKYSKAKNLEVVINYDTDKVWLSVSDDGCGFELTERKIRRSGFGLEIMREQVESIGGTILISSKPGFGTVIKAEFPPLPPPPPTGEEVIKCPLE